MNKKDLINGIASHYKIEKRFAKDIVEELYKEIANLKVELWLAPGEDHEIVLKIQG